MNVANIYSKEITELHRVSLITIKYQLIRTANNMEVVHILYGNGKCSAIMDFDSTN